MKTYFGNFFSEKEQQQKQSMMKENTVNCYYFVVVAVVRNLKLKSLGSVTLLLCARLGRVYSDGNEMKTELGETVRLASCQCLYST